MGELLRTLWRGFKLLLGILAIVSAFIGLVIAALWSLSHFPITSGIILFIFVCLFLGVDAPRRGRV